MLVAILTGVRTTVLRPGRDVWVNGHNTYVIQATNEHPPPLSPHGPLCPSHPEAVMPTCVSTAHTPPPSSPATARHEEGFDGDDEGGSRVTSATQSSPQTPTAVRPRRVASIAYSTWNILPCDTPSMTTFAAEMKKKKHEYLYCCTVQQERKEEYQLQCKLTRS